MTDRESLREPPFKCPDCGDEYVRLGQHWTVGDCDPALSTAQHAVIEGLVLAGTHATGGNLHVKTTNRKLIEWTAQKLGWLAGRITAQEPDDSHHQTIFELYTPSHWAVEKYDDWRDGPPQAYSLSKRAGQVWWAYAGHLEFHDNGTFRVGRISAKADAKADWVQRLFEGIGVSSDRYHTYVQLSSDDLRNWIDWIGDPAPGAERLWADSPLEYRVAA